MPAVPGLPRCRSAVTSPDSSSKPGIGSRLTNASQEALHEPTLDRLLLWQVVRQVLSARSVKLSTVSKCWTPY